MQFATIQPTVCRPDLPAITDEEAAALARTTVNLFRSWQLSDIEARSLLGDMAQRTWARWKEGGIGRIDRDLRARMAILMGIHKALRYLFTEPARGYAWIRKPNAAFADQSALSVMMRGEITDLIDLRSYLDAERSA
ncbi:MbcA/ParS/Xre antitoxin family protein [Cypionkella sp.]|uniref:MbcA/ParS/Xre antitoxin family protein n=1 Tax=Cypionkella sp. TaxID=2811411 RepID=UPI0027190794|nr:MbcA/ParS/Xre antitoxin family protein [Cypionkella sp.]MDO8986042.1 MbcA/ParS/Xre antitoxin family protein [Cypionkella sp.]MDP1578319.1 MbcA/ParS/Xre antitoxin family protein [Cypionkella sp.]MDP2051959.1 MbcA/ParS/Xre antitoxin family protein [Cypionkella sp.]